MNLIYNDCVKKKGLRESSEQIKTNSFWVSMAAIVKKYIDCNTN